MYILIKTILILLLILFSFQTKAEDVVVVGKITGQINFDGMPNEKAWQSATNFGLVMHSPSFGEKPSENSSVLVGYDTEYLWVSAQLNYKDPSTIVSTSKKRDEESKNPDAFGIIFDTYNDNENGLAFFTMPAGQRIDFSVSNDAVVVPSYLGSTNINYSWNTFWDVKTARTESGWSVEMRIPFSSLRFQEVDGKVQMGMLINRTISHCNEIDTYPAVDPKYGLTAPIKPSLATIIEFEGISNSKPIYVAPYVIAGSDKEWELNDSETAFNENTGKPFNAGLDVKYSLTSNLTLDLTVNTDFAQVEADDERVNLTRYSLFFPEKRMFFQERSSIFSFNLGGAEELFYSRRIGTDDGRPTPILGGARLTGKIGKWEVGIMDMQTGKTDNILSENFGIFRIRRQVINPNSYVGAILTSRIGTDGTSNYSYGVDGIFRIFGDDYVQVKVAQTTDLDGNNFTADTNPSFANLSWERRTEEGLGYDLSYSYLGENFDPQVGFIMRSGVTGVRLRSQYGWIPGAESKFFNYKLTMFYARSQRLIDNGLEMSFYGPGIAFTTKSGWTGRGGLYINLQGIYDEYSIADNVDVPVGEYKYLVTRLNASTPFSKPVSSEFSVVAGQFYDGNNFTVTAEPKVNLSASLQFSGYYNFNHVVFSKRNQELNAHVGRLKVLYMYNTKLSVSSFIQYNSVNHMTLTNFRLRYNPKEGNDLYLVYNEIRPTSGYFSEGVSETKFLSRIFQLKYVHTFRL